MHTGTVVRATEMFGNHAGRTPEKVMRPRWSSTMPAGYPTMANLGAVVGHRGRADPAQLGREYSSITPTTWCRAREKYAGTRLGHEELEAEILTEAEGAIA